MRIIIIIALFIFSIPSYGCTCWNGSFPLAYLNRNDTLPMNEQHYIIKGIVINTEVGSNVYNRWGHGNLVNVKVLEYWPNDAIMNDTVTIMNDESSCASLLVQDSTYLIGAWNTNRYLATSLCEGTDLFSKYANLIDRLGKSGAPRIGKISAPKLAEEDLEVRKPWWTVAFALSFLINLIFIVRRKKGIRNRR